MLNRETRLGCGITGADLLEIRDLVLPAAMVLAGDFANRVLTGQLLRTAVPAGAGDMALISASTGGDSRELVEPQVIRLAVFTVFPQIILRIAAALDSVV